MKPNLKVVRTPSVPKPYDTAKGLRRVSNLRSQLMAASVRYVLEGNDGTKKDRLRTASNCSGIPLLLIEVEVNRAAKG